MFSFFKRKKSDVVVPEWASILTLDQYEAFTKALQKYFARKKVDYQLKDGIVEVEENVFGFGQMGLMNLIQVCKQQDLKHYFEVVSGHFESIAQGKQFESQFEAMVKDFSQIQQYLAVRLYPVEFLDTLHRENTIGNDFATDVYAMLVFDLPHTVMNVKPKQAAEWNKSKDELFAIGLQNIRRNYPFQIMQEVLGEHKVWLVQGEHFFVPNIVFDIKNYPQFIGSKGSLVGIPHRHGALIYPIESLELINAVNSLIFVVNGMYQEGPGSLTNHLYWYHDGTFDDLPYVIEDKTLKFSPPDGFIEMLNALK